MLHAWMGSASVGAEPDDETLAAVLEPSCNPGAHLATATSRLHTGVLWPAAVCCWRTAEQAQHYDRHPSNCRSGASTLMIHKADPGNEGQSLQGSRRCPASVWNVHAAALALPPFLGQVRCVLMRVLIYIILRQAVCCKAAPRQQ